MVGFSASIGEFGRLAGDGNVVSATITFCQRRNACDRVIHRGRSAPIRGWHLVRIDGWRAVADDTIEGLIRRKTRHGRTGFGAASHGPAAHGTALVIALLRKDAPFGTGRILGLLLLVSLLALRVWDPGPIEVMRLKSFDIYQLMYPRVARQELVASSISTRKACGL